jgi:hypothetical protein
MDGLYLFNILLTVLLSMACIQMYIDGRNMTQRQQVYFRSFLSYLPVGFLVMGYGFIPDGTLPRLLT